MLNTTEPFFVCCTVEQSFDSLDSQVNRAVSLNLPIKRFKWHISSRAVISTILVRLIKSAIVSPALIHLSVQINTRKKKPKKKPPVTGCY